MLITRPSPWRRFLFPLMILLTMSVVCIGLVILNWQRVLIHFLPQEVAVFPSGHFFTAPTELRFTTPLKGKIRYTLDGSFPTSHSPEYVEPITATKSGIIRFAVFNEDGLLTQPQQHDFFIGEQHELPIMALSTEPESLWDPEVGIYVEGNHRNFSQAGKEWERPAMVRFYETDNELLFEQHVAIRLHGNAMRAMPQKSFRLYFTEEDGRDDRLRYPIFGPEGNEEYTTLILRNGGGDMRFSLLRDRLASDLALVLSAVDAQRSRPVVLYLNGEYWGLYYLQERFDEHFFRQKYRVDPEAFGLVEVPLDVGEDRGRVIPECDDCETDAERYNRLLDDTARCRDCMSYPNAELSIDLQNLQDYLLLELFFANYDWPYNNLKAWRYQTDLLESPEEELVPELDGRFRWLLFDSDVAFGAGQPDSESMIKAASGDPYAAFVDNNFPFRNLFYNGTFRQRYRERLQEWLASELSPEALTVRVDALAAEIRSEIPRHTARWGNEFSEDGLRSVPSAEQWEQEVELLKEFIRVRPEQFAASTARFMEASRLQP